MDTTTTNECGWLVLVDAASFHNRNYDEAVAAMTAEEIETHGMPEPWFPESPGDVLMEVPCGAPVVAGGRWTLCEAHTEAMEMPDVAFEQALREGRSWSGDLKPYD